jgi:hypothetical protein
MTSKASIKQKELAVFRKLKVIKRMDAQSCVRCLTLVECLLQQCVTARPSRNKFETSKYKV